MAWIDKALETQKISYGYLLPTKAELAYALGVSLGTIQNVLRMLEDNDYIYSKQCIGSIIKDRNDMESEIRKRTSKKDIAEEVSLKTNSVLVQILGNKVTLYKPRKKDPKIILPKDK